MQLVAKDPLLKDRVANISVGELQMDLKAMKELAQIGKEDLLDGPDAKEGSLANDEDEELQRAYVQFA